MLCSQCKNSIKPVVALDIDGTLGDYHAHFLRFAENYLDFPVVEHELDYDGAYPFSKWFCTVFGVDVTTFREIKLAYRQGAQKRTMPAWEGLTEFSVGLRQMDVEIWLTTTRPYLSLDGIDRDTREWLRRHQVRYDHLMYDENKYELLAERVDAARVAAVLDDEPEQYDKAEASFGAGVPILRATRYNRAVQRPNYVISLGAAQDAIQLRVDSWRKSND